MDDLELIKQKINIVDFIQEYLPLKKAGINFKSNCPFHNEKSPSFIVSPERQIWHCFGCQKGGDLFKFLMEKENIEFKEALEILAQKAGIVLQKSGGEKKDFKERLFEANLKAQEFFQYLLVKHPLGKKALEYLTERGLELSTIEQFGVGYAPNSWDSLTKFLLKRGFSTNEIISAGLGVPSKSGCYDRFRARIMFPLIDTKGRIIGFAGRVLYKAEPKYINTPQTVIFDKSNYLFGMNLAKSEVRAKDEAILVEGEIDVILSHQAGFKNVVASKGTGLTEGQIQLLKKYTSNISLCFDADFAGDTAARRGIEIADKAGLNIKIIQVAGGKDPAEAVKKDPKLWEVAIEQAMPVYDYYLHSAAGRYNLKNPTDLKKVSQELIPIWAKISDDLVREHYIHKLAAMLLTDEPAIRTSVNREKSGIKSYDLVLQNSNKKEQVKTVRSRRELLEEYLIALLLHIPKSHLYIPNFPETLLISEDWRQVYVLLVLYLDSISFKGMDFNINEFIKTLPVELVDEIDRVYLTDLDHQLQDNQSWQKEIEMVIAELKRSLIKSSLERLTLEIKNAQEFGKMELISSLNKKFRDLSVKLKNL